MPVMKSALGDSRKSTAWAWSVGRPQWLKGTSLGGLLSSRGESGMPTGVPVIVAAITDRKPFLEADLSEWREVLDVILTGTFIVSQQVARQTKRVGKPFGVAVVGADHQIVFGPKREQMFPG